jgi:uncharacterized protein with GYD domain
MRAYILVRFTPDTDVAKARHALSQPGISAVDLVMGPYDAVVTCEAGDFAQLGEIAKRVRGCPGIRESMTCPVIGDA